MQDSLSQKHDSQQNRKEEPFKDAQKAKHKHDSA